MERQRILVVDSDQLDCINCRLVLRGAEFVVFTTQCCDEALDKLARGKFDVVVMDIRLPNVCGGFDFLQDARMLQPDADFVVMAERPSIWDAKEAIRLGAFGYIGKTSRPEFMELVAREVFDRQGWIIKKADIDQFRDYTVPSAEKFNPSLYYKDGAWARHISDDIWEIGCDIKHWLLSGGRFLLKMPEGLSTFTAGTPCAKVLSCTSCPSELISPMTGTVREINTEVNNIASSIVPEELGENWMLWLARIQTPFPEKISTEDLIGNGPPEMSPAGFIEKVPTEMVV